MLEITSQENGRKDALTLLCHKHPGELIDFLLTHDKIMHQGTRRRNTLLFPYASGLVMILQLADERFMTFIINKYHAPDRSRRSF